MNRYLMSLGLAGFTLVLGGCAYDNASCTTGSCGSVSTTSYVPTTTYVAKTTYVPASYVAKTTYVPAKTYVVMPASTSTVQSSCCSTCGGQCGNGGDYGTGYGSYNMGWY